MRVKGLVWLMVGYGLVFLIVNCKLQIVNYQLLKYNVTVFVAASTSVRLTMPRPTRRVL